MPRRWLVHYRRAILLIIDRAVAGADKPIALFRLHIHRACLMGADGPIGNDALGGPLSCFVAQLCWIEASQNDKIERRSVSDRAVRASQEDLHLRTPHSEDADPDNLFLALFHQEHQAISLLRRQFCGICFLRLIFGARYAANRCQRQPKNLQEPHDVRSREHTDRCAFACCVALLSGFLLRLIFQFGVSSNSVAAIAFQ